jgi:hypothetical protein
MLWLSVPRINTVSWLAGWLKASSRLALCAHASGLLVAFRPLLLLRVRFHAGKLRVLCGLYPWVKSCTDICRILGLWVQLSPLEAASSSSILVPSLAAFDKHIYDVFHSIVVVVSDERLVEVRWVMAKDGRRDGSVVFPSWTAAGLEPC